MYEENQVWTIEEWESIKKTIKASKRDYRYDFILWLSENPHIWQAFVQKAIQAHRRAHKQRFSARAIIEVLRWETMLQERDTTFKISNTYVADLARLVMDEIPRLQGYFNTRASTIRKDEVSI